MNDLPEQIYRELIPTDLPALLDLDAIVQAELKERKHQYFIKQYLSEYKAKELEHLFDRKRHIILGAFHNNSLNGTLRLTVNQDELGKFHKILGTDHKLGYLGHGMVRSEYRGNDIMTRLVARAMDEAGTEECASLVTLVRPDNKPGLGVATKLWFDYIKQIQVAKRPAFVFSKEL